MNTSHTHPVTPPDTTDKPPSTPPPPPSPSTPAHTPNATRAHNSKTPPGHSSPPNPDNTPGTDCPSPSPLHTRVTSPWAHTYCTVRNAHTAPESRPDISHTARNGKWICSVNLPTGGTRRSSTGADDRQTYIPGSHTPHSPVEHTCRTHIASG